MSKYTLGIATEGVELSVSGGVTFDPEQIYSYHKVTLGRLLLIGDMGSSNIHKFSGKSINDVLALYNALNEEHPAKQYNHDYITRMNTILATSKDTATIGRILEIADHYPIKAFSTFLEETDDIGAVGVGAPDDST